VCVRERGRPRHGWRCTTPAPHTLRWPCALVHGQIPGKSTIIQSQLVASLGLLRGTPQSVHGKGGLCPRRYVARGWSCSRTVPKALWGSQGGGRFLMSEDRGKLGMILGNLGGRDEVSWKQHVVCWGNER